MPAPKAQVRGSAEGELEVLPCRALMLKFHCCIGVWGYSLGGAAAIRPVLLAHVAVEQMHPRGPRLRQFVKRCALVDQCLSVLTAPIRVRLKVLVNLAEAHQPTEHPRS